MDRPNLVTDWGLIDRLNLVTDCGLIDRPNFVTDLALRDGINFLTDWRLGNIANVFTDCEEIVPSSLFHWLLYLFSDTWSPFRLNKLLRSIWFEIPSFASNNRNRRKCVLVVDKGFDSTSPKVHRKANSLHINTTWMCQNIFITKVANLRLKIYCAISKNLLALDFWFGWTVMILGPFYYVLDERQSIFSCTQERILGLLANWFHTTLRRFTLPCLSWYHDNSAHWTSRYCVWDTDAIILRHKEGVTTRSVLNLTVKP